MTQGEIIARLRGDYPPGPEQHVLRHAASEIERLQAEVTDLRVSVVSYGILWATRWAKEQGLPEGHLHPDHYDRIAKAGARMNDFTRAEMPTR